MKKSRPLILYLFTSLFLIAGATGLIYEIVWKRFLELCFGVHSRPSRESIEVVPEVKANFEGRIR